MKTVAITSIEGRTRRTKWHAVEWDETKATMTLCSRRAIPLITVSITLFLLTVMPGAEAAAVTRGQTPSSRCQPLGVKADRPSSSPLSQSPSGASGQPCRYFLNGRRGTITTPGFPSLGFSVPFTCSWFINATAFEPDSFITLYLTQMYLNRGVRALQYSALNVNESHFSTVGRRELDDLHMQRPRPFSVYRIKTRYLEVQVNLKDLFNANVRVDRRLMDVYGFNITYEIQPNGSRIRTDTCTAINCTFNGHCYANHNYSQFQCSCFPGFSGRYCQYGPDCNPALGINLCKNGGSCSYRTGASMVRCSCPPNYNGSLCEYRRPFIPSKECLSRFRLNCSHQCVMTDKGGAACRCPSDHALKSDGLNCYPLVSLRLLGEMEIERPPLLNDTQLLELVANQLQKDATKYTADKLALSSVELTAPHSNRFRFLLWNSEAYNMSRDGRLLGPVAAALRSIYSPTRATSTTAMPTTILTTFSPTELMSLSPSSRPVSFGLVNRQWSNSISSFVKMINTTTWKIDSGSDLPPLTVSMNFSAEEVPALVIDWVRLDVKDNQVREGYSFHVVCKTNGLNGLWWYKDGYPVDPAAALLRNVSIYVNHVQDLRGFNTLNLEVKKATVADRGEYECRVNQWGQSARMSIFLEVITPPVLDLTPANPSVLVNTAVNLSCRDENHLARRSMTKYVWLKNGQPIESSCEETIEDLTPVGSLLKIRSIQQSTNYTCRGLNVSMTGQQTTKISVVINQERDACPEERWMRVNWSMTAVDTTDFEFCPPGYFGVAKRMCSRSTEVETDQSNTSTWRWETPDFSHCMERVVVDLQRQLKLITLGYAVADVPSIVDQFSRHILKRVNKIELVDRDGSSEDRENSSSVLPGEGKPLLELAKNVETFLFKRINLIPSSFWNTTAVDYLQALDVLLFVAQQNFFHPDDVTPLLRLQQNHIAMLAERCTDNCLPTDGIKSFLQVSPKISDKLEFKYTNKWSYSLTSFRKGFKSIQSVAPPQLVISANGSRTVFNIDTSDQTFKGGDFICAFLQLHPMNYSPDWDVGSCKIKRENSSSFRCHCPHSGTTVLLYATRAIQEPVHPVMNLWIVVWFAVGGSYLLIAATIVVLIARLCSGRSLWAWLQFQLGLTLIPLSTSYVMPHELGKEDLWTNLLTVATYHYLSTLIAMSVHLRTSWKSGETRRSNTQRNLRYIGFSFGVSLMISGTHILLEELTKDPFSSWLLNFRSLSGILFCFVYSWLFLVLVVLHIFARRKTIQLEKTGNDLELEQRINYERYCLLLTVLNVPLTGALLCDYRFLHHSETRWTSVQGHCAMSIVHFLAVLLWSVVVLLFSGEDDVVVAVGRCWRRDHMPVTSETVTDLLNATALVESPQHKGIRSTDIGRQVNGVSCSTAGGGPEVHLLKNKRSKRVGRASSPLLVRAGLGPEVQRAFDPLEEEHLMDDCAGNDGGPDQIIISEEEILTIGKRKDSSTTIPDDMDSGFGHSGGGGSQKLSGFDRFSDAWKILWRIGWKLPFLLRGSNECERGSFRSRHSTMSSATTTEFGVESKCCVTKNENDDVRSQQFGTNLTDANRMCRSKKRQKEEDYCRERDLKRSRPVEIVGIKPFRGQCFIRNSPELRPHMHHGNRLFGDEELASYRRISRSLSVGQQSNCERCWHNPETPYCDLCIGARADQLHPGRFFIRAVIEKPPQHSENGNGEYLTMDTAGSLAIDQQVTKPPQEYYNTRLVAPSSSNALPIRPRASSSSISGNPSSFAGSKKILNGRIAKKYRRSLCEAGANNPAAFRLRPGTKYGSSAVQKICC